MTVNEITRRWPEALAILHRFGIDLCCGGWMPLERAAHEAGVQPRRVLAELTAVVQAEAGEGETKG